MLSYVTPVCSVTHRDFFYLRKASKYGHLGLEEAGWQGRGWGALIWKRRECLSENINQILKGNSLDATQHFLVHERHNFLCLIGLECQDSVIMASVLFTCKQSYRRERRLNNRLCFVVYISILQMTRQWPKSWQEENWTRELNVRSENENQQQTQHK